MTTPSNSKDRSSGSCREGDEGFMLLGLIVAISIILLILGAAATKTAFSLRREREMESARRADQYIRAIRRYYLKNQHYPGSMEQLENTNRVRYLRQRYVDPLTGKNDYRLILVGQNKTTVKGFFGEPLGGLATTGLGAAAGMQSSGIPGPTAGGVGTSPTSGTAGSTSATSLVSTGPAGAPGSAAGPAGAAGATGGFGQSPAIAQGLPGAAGPFMGVGSSATGSSLITVNGQTTYETWEFLYDPRLERLRQAAALNAGANSVGAGALGTAPGALGTTNGTGPAGATSASGSGNTPPVGTPPP